MHFINLHTHHPTGAPDVFEVESLHYGQPASGKTSLVSVGLHPWHLRDIDFPAAASWLRQQAAKPDTVAIGEAGLDKVIETPWEKQVQAFKLCLQVAAEFDKPLIIHCVKAHGEVLQLLHRPPFARRKGAFAIFHGFDKHPQTAQMLLAAGCYLSFGAALFRENSPAAAALEQTPADRFFLETDDKIFDIKAVYAKAAEIRGVLADQVKVQVWDNFHAAFE